MSDSRDLAHSPAEGRQRIAAYFDSKAPYWSEVYEDGGLEGEIYRDRRAAALAWIDALDLPRGTRMLELGCGAGRTSVALAERGYAVEGIDASEAMVDLAARHARDRGVGGQVSVRLGDAHALPLDDESVLLVLALGVLPWLHSPSHALAEVSRVLRPGGYALVTADSRARLTHLLDPRLNPLLRPAREALKALLRMVGLLERRPPGFDRQTHYRRQVDRLLTDAGFSIERRATVGFGPFTVAGRAVLRAEAGLRLHRRLQGLADRGLPGLRYAGAHYLVLARKPEGG